MPGDVDLATFTLGPVGALRHRRPFTEASLAEIRDVKAITGADTLFQIEVPVELVLLTKAPAPARPVLARLLAKSVTNLAAATPPRTRFGVHLCLGDMNNRAFGTMSDVARWSCWPTPSCVACPIAVPWTSCTHPSPLPTIQPRRTRRSTRPFVTWTFPRTSASQPGSPTSPNHCPTSCRSARSSTICSAARLPLQPRAGSGDAPSPTAGPCSSAPPSSAPPESGVDLDPCVALAALAPGRQAHRLRWHQSWLRSPGRPGRNRAVRSAGSSVEPGARKPAFCVRDEVEHVDRKVGSPPRTDRSGLEDACLAQLIERLVGRDVRHATDPLHRAGRQDRRCRKVVEDE